MHWRLALGTTDLDDAQVPLYDAEESLQTIIQSIIWNAALPAYNLTSRHQSAASLYNSTHTTTKSSPYSAYFEYRERTHQISTASLTMPGRRSSWHDNLGSYAKDAFSNGVDYWADQYYQDRRRQEGHGASDRRDHGHRSRSRDHRRERSRDRHGDRSRGHNYERPRDYRDRSRDRERRPARRHEFPRYEYIPRYETEVWKGRRGDPYEYRMY